jgi:hypothetical protein
MTSWQATRVLDADVPRNGVVPAKFKAATSGLFTFALGCLVVALLIDLCVYRIGHPGPPIRSDGFGYYIYLPAIFIHHDIFFTFFNDPAAAAVLHTYYPLPDWSWTGLSAHGDGFLDKFPAGVAILQSPFFLAAWAIARMSYAGPLSGFESPFQIAICVAGACYFAAGVYLLLRTLAARTNGRTAILCVLFALTTTNVVLYASFDASLSRVYSFFLVSALCAIAGSSDRSGARAFAFGLALGLAVVVRPTNLIAALLIVELTANSTRRQVAKALALVACGGTLGASPQMLTWWLTTGHAIYYSYGDEGFAFSQPQVINYLFSIRKGVFFWHPAYLLMILSLIAHYRNYRREALVFLAMIAANFYLGMVWHSWWFGGSFGSRQTIDVLPAMVIAAGSAFALLQMARPLITVSARWLAIGLAVVNSLQTYGYIAGKIPFDESTWTTYNRFWNPYPALVRAITHQSPEDTQKGTQK